MSDTPIYDVAIIGGGIVGTAAAMALQQKGPWSMILLEAEDRLAAHQTGNNSGVIHSGLYYRPGSLKAKNCVTGRQRLVSFCSEHSIPYDQCGKVVVATRDDEIPRLDSLEERGRLNGLTGIRRLGPVEIREIEPHVTGIAGLFIPQTGIVDFIRVTEKFGDIFASQGGRLEFSFRVRSIRRSKSFIELSAGKRKPAIRCRNLVNCAGLQSDRIARMSGLNPGLRIIPFRGEYYEIKEERQNLVNNLIYPVPDPEFPFLGVHFTRMIHGGVEAGPNAVLAFKREGYRKTSFSLSDFIAIMTYPGFLRLGTKYWRMGMAEMYRSWNKRAFVKALKRLIPELDMDSLIPGNAGVRAQALEANGALVDDFRIIEADRMIHILNAPSPAATASISIGETIARKAAEKFLLH